MPTVFLIEDDILIGELVREYLKESGFEIEVEANGARALERLQQGFCPALILLDSQMPAMSGADFMAELKKTPLTACDTPVFLFSAERDVSEKAKILGCAGSLKKPVDLKDLREIVERYAIAQ
jgi:CheY-like chemotaxis protein